MTAISQAVLLYGLWIIFPSGEEAVFGDWDTEDESRG